MPSPQTDAFLADPVDYLQGQASVLGFADNVRAGSVTQAPGLGGVQFTQSAALFPAIDVFTASPGLPSQPVHEIRLVGRPAEQHVRYLPDQANGLTFMVLDAAAQWVFTGPLSGCHIYVVTGGGNTSLYHVNDNATLDDIAANKRAKDRRMKNALPVGSVITHRLARYQYHNPDLPYQGFVFGRNPGAGWQFWYHTVSLDGAGTDSRTAPLPDFPGGAFLTGYWNGL